MERCFVCNRRLKNPDSMRLGIGPVCRGKDSITQHREATLFNSAEYQFQIISGVICIVDLDQGGKSVTNDIENVLADIGRSMDLTARTIIYQDSTGMWDGINHVGSKFTGFYPIQEQDLGKALDKVLQ